MPSPERKDLATCVGNWIAARRKGATAPQILYISGAQGIGKSTALTEIARQNDGTVLAMSLDDFYLTQAERKHLSQTVHPLFTTRGPPGTHDLNLLNATLDALSSIAPLKEVKIPVFDKRRDDRAPRQAWRTVNSSPDMIIIEGWMMGVEADPSAPATAPINAVEAEDKLGIWRRYQEDQLSNGYARLWDRADSFLHLDAPSFDSVLAWRLEQERANLGAPSSSLLPDRAAWVSRFILHYERLTRRMLAGHRRPGTSIKVNNARKVVSVDDPGGPNAI